MIYQYQYVSQSEAREQGALRRGKTLYMNVKSSAQKGGFPISDCIQKGIIAKEFSTNKFGDLYPFLFRSTPVAFCRKMLPPQWLTYYLRVALYCYTHFLIISSLFLLGIFPICFSVYLCIFDYSSKLIFPVSGI